MAARIRIGATLVVTGAVVLAWHAPARAAADVDVGGYLDEAMQAMHRDLARRSVESGSRVTLGGVQISVEAGESSVVTGFTPRFAGPGTGRLDRFEPGNVARDGRLELTEPEPQRHGLRIGPDGGATVGGVQFDWSAIAEMEEGADAAIDSSSPYLVGGEMAVSNWRVDATYGHGQGPLGLEGDRYTAGLGYDFGPLNTRVAYSMIENHNEATETSMFTVGSRLSLQPWLVLEGDLAYAEEEEQGTADTAGRVSLRFNF